ncbi:phenylacetate--CoA ligase PaaK [Streptomyces sp. NPDC097619]|uniref:phenylacetate--CoA ligase PaaK n=1 Tax=Streptomyces sp. NPDC097619 TaxID=3157228 RepID=UPI00332E81A7
MAEQRDTAGRDDDTRAPEVTGAATAAPDPLPLTPAPAPTAAPGPGGPDPAELLDRAGLEALQLERLRATLRHAYEKVPFHRAAFDRAGVRPEDCRTLADLARFPFTTKTDLRDTYPFGMFAVPRSEVRRIHASSGTTGQPTVVGYTAHDLDVWAEVVARSLRAAGVRPGHTVHVAYGYGLFTGGLGAHYGAERLGCTVVPASGGATERQVRLILDFEPEVIMVTPSYMLTLLDEMERQGVDPRSTSLRTGVFGAEPWTEEMRREIEGRLGIDAVDVYGLSEVMGPGVAQEFATHKDGLTVWEDHFLPEVVDPITGEVLPEGEPGELVFTSLTKEALPVVRYRTRDLTRLLPGTALSAFRRMEKVTGRSDDMIIVRGVNLYPTAIEEILLRTPGVAPHFQLRLTREGRLDSLTVRAEARPGADAGTREAAAASVARAVKEGLGLSAAVEIVAPETLERSVGKIKRVVDLRKD